MNGSYNKYPTVCYLSDLHHFKKMQKGMDPDYVWVRKVKPGDVVTLFDEIVAKWKIVEDEDGYCYLGFIPRKCYFINPGKTINYVVGIGSNTQKRQLVIYRIKNRDRVNAIAELLKG